MDETGLDPGRQTTQQLKIEPRGGQQAGQTGRKSNNMSKGNTPEDVDTVVS